MKKNLLGYFSLFLLILIGLTLALPFILTIALAIGFIYPAGLPFPPARTEIFLLFSIIITLIFGGLWIYYPPQKQESWLNELRLDLIASKKQSLLRFVGILVAFPLFAFILIPPASFWLGLESVSYHLDVGRMQVEKIYLSAAFVSGFIWLVVVIGKLCPQARKIKKVLFPLRLLFIDWVLEPNSPKAAREERKALYENCNNSPLTP